MTTVTERHSCRWPGCPKKVKHELWGCHGHWMRLPTNLRAEIWRTYRAAIETQGVSGEAYLKAEEKVQSWIKAHEIEMRIKRVNAHKKFNFLDHS